MPDIRAALYLRVSDESQESANQLPSMQAFCQHMGWEVVHVYEETTSAWRNGHQVQLKQAYTDGRRGRFDVLVVWALDRLSREGIAAILGIVNRFAGAGVHVVSVQDPWTLRPHVGIVASYHSMDAAVAAEEQHRLAKRFQATGRSHSKPFSSIAPFMLFSLPPEERPALLPWFVVRILVPAIQLDTHEAILRVSALTYFPRQCA